MEGVPDIHEFLTSTISLIKGFEDQSPSLIRSTSSYQRLTRATASQQFTMCPGHIRPVDRIIVPVRPVSLNTNTDAENILHATCNYPPPPGTPKGTGTIHGELVSMQFTRPRTSAAYVGLHSPTRPKYIVDA